ncbi:cytochrome c-type biogenesis protein [Thalassotalea agariperforans]
MKKSLLALFFGCLASWLVVASPVDTYEFKDQVTKDRYQALVKELRCPKCQNQNLADSNSQIAIDLRAQVYTMLNEGKADSEIVNYMVARYGDFVLYRPQVSSLTYILWYGPIGLLLIGGVVMFLVLRKKPEAIEEKQLSAQQQQKLQQFLKDK